MRTRMKRLATVLMVFLALAVTADAVATTGREVADEGTPTMLSGTLKYRDNEWYLETRDDLFEVHMGPLGHEEKLPLNDGAAVQMWGFMIPEHIAPITVSIEGETFEVWHEDRYPTWAGSGDRKNSVDEQGADRAEAIDGARRLALNRDEAVEQDDVEQGRELSDDFEPLYRNREFRPGRGR